MRPGNRSLLALLSVLLGVGVLAPATPAHAAGPASLVLTAPAAYAGARVTLRATLTDGGGVPIPNATVTVQRGPAYGPGTIVTTGQDGVATLPVTVSRTSAANAFRGSYTDPETSMQATGQVRVQLKRRASRVTVGGPTRVVDGRSVGVTVRWTTRRGQPVPGTVRLFRALGSGAWKKVATLRTNAEGRAGISTRPRLDSRWRATAVPQAWVEGDRSSVHRVDNLPPGVPVRLPDAAPRPRVRVPAQGRAVGAGANLAVTAVPDGVWNQMTGISWHSGCPVGRSGLRLVRVNYWDYQGYARRGELVAGAAAAGPMGAALAEMFRRKLPVRAMYRVDRFGYGQRSHGGNDYRSMAAGNTSAFNCRDVTGRPGVRSPHSYGGSLDLNTWENPYRSAQGLVPNSWWQGHSHPRVAWRSRSHPVVALMARHGFRWTYGLGDTQHFDYVGSRARAAARPIPCDMYCD
jgi:hypothetical protein